jgi:zinc protease
LSEVVAMIDAEVQQLATDGPSEAEMERVLAQAEAQFVYRLQTVGGFGGKSDQLNAYNTYMGDPGFFRKDLERYRRATDEGLRRAAARWLVPDGRVVLSVVPRGRVALALERSSPAVVS